jgi:hypothetical protein
MVDHFTNASAGNHEGNNRITSNTGADPIYMSKHYCYEVGMGFLYFQN